MSMATQEEPEIRLHCRSREWLRSDREYCRVKDMLILFFSSRECGAESDELADQVFDQVEKRLVNDPDFVEEFEGPPIRWFWGVARKFLAKARQRRKIYALPEPVGPEDRHQRLDCLDQCLSRMIDRQKTLILEYYGYEEGEKIAHRKKLAKRMGLTMNALRLRTFKIRRPIQQCVSDCLKSRNSEGGPADHKSAG